MLSTISGKLFTLTNPFLFSLQEVTEKTEGSARFLCLCSLCFLLFKLNEETSKTFVKDYNLRDLGL